MKKWKLSVEKHFLEKFVFEGRGKIITTSNPIPHQNKQELSKLYVFFWLFQRLPA